MRFLIAPLMLVAVFCLGGFRASGGRARPGSSSGAGQAGRQHHTHSSGGGVWWQSPIWIAIGVIALILVVLMITMIGRGGGTTIVKD